MALNTLSIQKLTGRDNFSTWKFAMEAYMQHEELWECIQSDTCDSKKDTKARTKIILMIDPQLYVHVQDAKTAKQVWDNLLKAFEDTGLLRKVGLLRDLITTNLETSTNIEEYINKLMSTAHKLRGIGFNVDDEWLGTLMLAGLSQEYKPMIIMDLGTARQCIGFKITQNTNLEEISLEQTVYIEKILHRFKMNDCKPVPTPFEAGTQLKKAENQTEVLKNVPYQEAVECLLYLSQGTRPDIAYAVNNVSRFNNNPTMQHWIAVKRIFRYLKGTIDLKLTFKKDNKNIVGYCDADWASDTLDRRSCTGYLFIFQGACISWNSRKQATVALSSTEAEYMSLASAVQEAIWLRQLNDDIWHNFSGIPMTIYCDNSSAISLSGSNVYHARSKHIDVRYNFVKEKVAAKEIHVEHISTEFMLADALTKGLYRPKLCHLTIGMGLRSGEVVGRVLE